MRLKDNDKKFLGRDGSVHDIEIVQSENSVLISADGKEYIDFYTGWCVGNIGWNNKVIKKRLRNYAGPDYVMPSFLYKPWVELAELLAKITPGKLTKSYRATGGTEAVEIALRAAGIYTKRNKFISIEGSYHGASVAALSVGSSEYREYPNVVNNYKIKPPLTEEALQQVEHYLSREDVAAFIMEPIITALAVHIPERGFMTGLAKLCKKYGTLLIIDEVATGFGRTGKLFGIEYYDVHPDIMCMAKAITGGYAAMGATIITPEVAKGIESKMSYYSTYGWHPLSVEAALSNIHYMLDHQQELENNTLMLAEFFNKRLAEIPFKSDRDICVKGLAIGIKFDKKNYAAKLVKKAEAKGLLIPLNTESELVIFPALNTRKDIAKKALDILESCV